MSDIVKQIRLGIESCIKTAVGPEWLEIENKFNLDNNSFKNQKKRYGVIAQDGSSSGAQINTFITITRSFEITLIEQYISTLNKDSNPQGAIDILENAMDDILRLITNSKAKNPGIVLNTQLASISGPNLNEIENLVILRFVMAVGYRSPLGSCI